MYNENEEPEPDYLDESDAQIEVQKERSSSQSSDESLIQPKKLANPCVESPTRLALHKELLLNYKRFVVLQACVLAFYFIFINIVITCMLL